MRWTFNTDVISRVRMEKRDSFVRAPSYDKPLGLHGQILAQLIRLNTFNWMEHVNVNGQQQKKYQIEFRMEFRTR